MIEVGFCELHDSVFLGGRNLSAKLDGHRYPDLKMQYDKVEKELHVTWGGKEGIIPSTNIKIYHPGKPLDRQILQVASPHIANVSFTAQVETPFGHVHEGPGKGKTGKSK